MEKNDKLRKEMKTAEYDAFNLEEKVTNERGQSIKEITIENELNENANNEIKNGKKKYRAIDLFAGIGGIRLGFKQAFSPNYRDGHFENESDDQIEFVFSNEINEFAAKTYRENFKQDPLGDITKVHVDEIPDFDILLAGFPCQAFSIAGKQRGFNDTRGTLFFYIADILKKKRPIAFLLENVKNLVHHDKGRTFQVIKDVLTEDLGYYIHYKILNAKDFGVPQNRERIYIVGFRDNIEFSFPTPPKTPVKLEDILEKDVDESFYLSQEYYLGLQKHKQRHKAKGHGFGFEIRPKDGVANALVCGGMGKERNLIIDKIPENHWKNEGDSLRLRNPKGIRKLTPREWARLQGFPDSFKFPVSKTQAYKQLGNSVAVPVIRAIAEQMKKALENYKIITPDFELTKTERRIIQVMEKLIEKKAMPKSGEKSVISLGRFIETNYLRVDDLEGFLKSLERYGIATKYNNKVRFSREFTNSNDSNEIRKKLFRLFKQVRSKGIPITPLRRQTTLLSN